MTIDDLKPGLVVTGPVLPEPIEVLLVDRLGDMIKITGAGKLTGQVHQRVLHPDQLATLEAGPAQAPYDGDPERFRIGIEAQRLALAYQYDPFIDMLVPLTG